MNNWVTGQQLKDGKYIIDGLLGMGGFGVTYRAIEQPTGKLVAIKTLNFRSQRKSNFAELQEKFLSEAMRLAMCRHDHIVKVHPQLFQEDGLWCMVMECIEGQDLDSYINEHGVLSESEGLRIIKQIGDALTVVHNQGFLHRDVKPHNIILRSNTLDAVLIDFGLAREFTPNQVQSHSNDKTQHFAPIEQYEIRAERGAYTDVYALAATLYVLLTKELPVPANIRQCNIPLDPPKQYNPRISDRVNSAILKGMALQPKDRPQSVQEWLELLPHAMPDDDFNLHEEQIAEFLTARNLSGLFELLLELKGLRLNQDYTLKWLYAVGGQSIAYLAESSRGEMAIAKMAFLPYHRAAYVSTEAIRRARHSLEREASLLQQLRDSGLPKFHNLIYATNPLHSLARGDEIVNREPYLVMEFIRGRNLLNIARKAHRNPQTDYETLELLAWEVATTVTDFSIKIAARTEAYLYSDFNPRNLMLTDNPNNPVRILDAGSLILLDFDSTVSPPFTETYVPPEYYEAYDKGETLWPTPSYVMYTLGKTLWEVLTNRQPYPAEDPNMSEPILKNYSRHLQDLILNLVLRRYISFEHLKQVIESMSVSTQIQMSNLTGLFNM